MINYDGNDKRKFAWGASVDRMKDNIVSVKLLLDPSQERPLYLPTGTHTPAFFRRLLDVDSTLPTVLHYLQSAALEEVT